MDALERRCIIFLVNKPMCSGINFYPAIVARIVNLFPVFDGTMPSGPLRGICCHMFDVDQLFSKI